MKCKLLPKISVEKDVVETHKYEKRTVIKWLGITINIWRGKHEVQTVWFS